MTTNIFVAGIFNNLFRGLISQLPDEEKNTILQGGFFGGLAGAVCAVPMVILGINQNQREKLIGRLFLLDTKKD